MGPARRSPSLIEYVWPCGHHENVLVEKAPGISFVRGQFSLPIAKSPEEFTEEERKGVPGRRKCCRCWASSSLFKPLEACGECDHAFADCSNCMIVNSSGSREIATSDKRVIGEFDQTPEAWRCGECETINAFDDDGAFNGFLAPKVANYAEATACKKCHAPFMEETWVISPFSIYLGTWNGTKVAEGGPWHWNLEWHRGHTGQDHKKDECYGPRKTGRRRRENPCINKNFTIEPRKEDKVVPVSAVVAGTPESSTPPTPSSQPKPEQPPEEILAGDDQPPASPQLEVEGDEPLDSPGFTIGDYGDDGIPEDYPVYQERHLSNPYDDQTTADLGSYYNPPPTVPYGEDEEDGQTLDDYYHENPPLEDEPDFEPEKHDGQPRFEFVVSGPQSDQAESEVAAPEEVDVTPPTDEVTSEQLVSDNGQPDEVQDPILDSDQELDTSDEPIPKEIDIEADDVNLGDKLQASAETELFVDGQSTVDDDSLSLQDQKPEVDESAAVEDNFDQVEALDVEQQVFDDEDSESDLANEVDQDEKLMAKSYDVSQPQSPFADDAVYDEEVEADIDRALYSPAYAQPEPLDGSEEILPAESGPVYEDDMDAQSLVEEGETEKLADVEALPKDQANDPIEGELAQEQVSDFDPYDQPSQDGGFEDINQGGVISDNYEEVESGSTDTDSFDIKGECFIGSDDEAAVEGETYQDDKGTPENDFPGDDLSADLPQNDLTQDDNANYNCSQSQAAPISDNAFPEDTLEAQEPALNEEALPEQRKSFDDELIGDAEFSYEDATDGEQLSQQDADVFTPSASDDEETSPEAQEEDCRSDNYPTDEDQPQYEADENLPVEDDQYLKEHANEFFEADRSQGDDLMEGEFTPEDMTPAESPVKDEFPADAAASYSEGVVEDDNTQYQDEAPLEDQDVPADEDTPVDEKGYLFEEVMGEEDAYSETEPAAKDHYRPEDQKFEESSFAIEEDTPKHDEDLPAQEDDYEPGGEDFVEGERSLPEGVLEEGESLYDDASADYDKEAPLGAHEEDVKYDEATSIQGENFVADEAQYDDESPEDNQYDEETPVEDEEYPGEKAHYDNKALDKDQEYRSENEYGQFDEEALVEGGEYAGEDEAQNDDEPAFEYGEYTPENDEFVGGERSFDDEVFEGDDVPVDDKVFGEGHATNDGDEQPINEDAVEEEPLEEEPHDEEVLEEATVEEEIQPKEPPMSEEELRELEEAFDADFLNTVSGDLGALEIPSAEDHITFEKLHNQADTEPEEDGELDLETEEVLEGEDGFGSQEELEGQEEFEGQDDGELESHDDFGGWGELEGEENLDEQQFEDDGERSLDIEDGQEYPEDQEGPDVQDEFDGQEDLDQQDDLDNQDEFQDQDELQNDQPFDDGGKRGLDLEEGQEDFEGQEEYNGQQEFDEEQDFEGQEEFKDPDAVDEEEGERDLDLEAEEGQEILDEDQDPEASLDSEEYQEVEQALEDAEYAEEHQSSQVEPPYYDKFQDDFDEDDLDSEFFDEEDDEDLFTVYDDDEEKFIVEKNTYGVLDTPAAALYGPPGMTHDLDWDDDDDEELVYEGEYQEGQEEYAEEGEEEHVEGEEEEGEPLEEEEYLQEGEAEEEEYPEEEQPEEEFLDEEDGERSLDEDEVLEEEEEYAEENEEGEEEEFAEDEEEELPEEEYLEGEAEYADEEGFEGEEEEEVYDEEDGERRLDGDMEEGEFAEEEGEYMEGEEEGGYMEGEEEGEYMEGEEGEGEFDPEMEGDLEDCEHGLDEDFMDGEEEYAEEGEFDGEGEEFAVGEELGEEGEFGEEGGFDEEGEFGEESEFGEEGEFEDGERSLDEDFEAEGMEGDFDEEEFAEGEYQEDGELADGEGFDGELTDGEGAEGEYAEGDLPVEELGEGDYQEDFGEDGDRGLEGETGEPFDGELADDGFAQDEVIAEDYPEGEEFGREMGEEISEEYGEGEEYAEEMGGEFGEEGMEDMEFGEGDVQFEEELPFEEEAPMEEAEEELPFEEEAPMEEAYENDMTMDEGYMEEAAPMEEEYFDEEPPIDEFGATDDPTYDEPAQDEFYDEGGRAMEPMDAGFEDGYEALPADEPTYHEPGFDEPSGGFGDEYASPRLAGGDDRGFDGGSGDYQAEEPAYQEPEPQYEDAAESAYEPEPAYDAEPEPAYEPAYEPEPEPAYDPEPEPAYDPESEPAYEPEPESAYEPDSDRTFEAEPEPAYEPDPEAAYEPEPEPSYEPEPEPEVYEEAEFDQYEPGPEAEQPIEEQFVEQESEAFDEEPEAENAGEIDAQPDDGTFEDGFEVQEVIEEVYDDAVEEAYEEPVGEVYEEPIGEVDEEPYEEPVQKMYEEPAQEVYEDADQEIYEEPADIACAEPAEDVYEETAPEHMEEMSEEPAYDESSGEAYGEPPYDEPTYDEPAYKEPAYEEPAVDAYEEPATELTDEQSSDQYVEVVEDPVAETTAQEQTHDEPAEQYDEEYVEEQLQDAMYDKPSHQAFKEQVSVCSEQVTDGVAQDPTQEHCEDPGEEKYEEPVHDLYSGQGWGDDLTEDDAANNGEQQEHQEEFQPEPEDNPEPTPSYNGPVHDLSPPPSPPLEQPQLESEAREDESETIIVYSEEEVVYPMTQEIQQVLDEALNEEPHYPEDTDQPDPMDDQYSPPMTPTDNTYGHDEFPPSSNDYLKSPTVASNWGRQSQLLSPRPLTPPPEGTHQNTEYTSNPLLGWDASQHRPVTPPDEPQDHQILSPLTFQQSPLVGNRFAAAEQCHEEQYNSATEMHGDDQFYGNRHWAGGNTMPSPELSGLRPSSPEQEPLEDKGPYPAFLPRSTNSPVQQTTRGSAGLSTMMENSRSLKADPDAFSSELDSFDDNQRSSEPEFEIMNVGARSPDTYDPIEDSPFPRQMQPEYPEPAFEEYAAQQTSVSPVKVQSVEYQIPHDQASIEEYMQEEPAGPYDDYGYVQPEQIPQEDYKEQRPAYRDYTSPEVAVVQFERVVEQQQYQLSPPSPPPPSPPPPQSRPLSLFPRKIQPTKQQARSDNHALRSINQGAYQSNGPMQMNTVLEDNSENMATANVIGKQGAKTDTQRYRWLLSLMATATLGFGMESLEEQFQASRVEPSGWTFKGLFGTGKRKQSPGSMSGGSSPIANQMELPQSSSQQRPQYNDTSTSRGLNVIQNSSARTPSMAAQPSNQWNSPDDIVKEPESKKKGVFAWFGRRNKNAVDDVEAPRPTPQESYEIHSTNQALAVEPTRQRNNQGHPHNFQSPQMMASQQLPANDLEQAPRKPGFWARLFGKRSQPRNATPLASSCEVGPAGSAGINTQQPVKKKGFWARLFSRSKKKQPQTADDIEMGNMNAQDEQIPRVGRVKSGSPQLIQCPNRRTSAVGAIVWPNVRRQQTPQHWQQTIPEDDEAEFDELPKPRKKRGLFARSRGRKSENTNKNNKGKGKAVDKKIDGEWEDMEEQRHEMATLPPTQPKPARVKKYGAVVASSEGLAQQHVTGPKQKERGNARTGAAAANPRNWFWMDVYWK
ncbi:hypothetical protein QBC36DRAFT_81137 [Triangularia setosa]|uniref:Uncharacterized protein n=1 Tax=Triangularia setosa TaxID=2587417 RepID=A0AAN6VYJ6_9PEZI|nr:hypothetical protein QBC36DRAFT_81137 [Podospora setosa]